MRIVMRLERRWQDAGVERVLTVGAVYDVPDPVAHALIATGAAEHPRVIRAPETKPVAPFETKEQRRRPA